MSKSAKPSWCFVVTTRYLAPAEAIREVRWVALNEEEAEEQKVGMNAS